MKKEPQILGTDKDGNQICVGTMVNIVSTQPGSVRPLPDWKFCEPGKFGFASRYDDELDRFIVHFGDGAYASFSGQCLQVS